MNLLERINLKLGELKNLEMAERPKIETTIEKPVEIPKQIGRAHV